MASLIIFRAVASNSLGLAFGTNRSFSLPAFSDIGAGLAPIVTVAGGARYWQRSAAWGDYDRDGRLDIVISASNFVTRIWRNTGVGFSNAAIPLVSYFGPVSWTDYNNDGWLDLAMSAAIAIATNGGSGFARVALPLAAPAGYTPGGWTVMGDLDNDGRKDPLLTGYLYENVGSGYSIATLLSRNVGPGLIADSFSLQAAAGMAAWGDFDNDGRLDVALTGYTNLISGRGIAQVWRNTGAGFTNSQAGLPGLIDSSIAWGDYDNDGRLDLVLTGGSSTNGTITATAQLWRNTGNGFTPIQTGLPGVEIGGAAWGDYDNDGRLDILLSGKTNAFDQAGGVICQLWRNTGAGFSQVPQFGPPGLCGGTASWGDFDNYGRLDILLVGFTNWFAAGYPTGAVSQVWRNLTALPNTPPSAPGGLSVSISNQTATFSWNASSDAQTPSSGMTYNLRVGTTPGGSEVVSPLSLSSGRRQVPEHGNAGMRRSQSINGLPLGTPLFWSVQAVDNGFAGSAFAPDRSFTFNTVFTPTNGAAVFGDADGDGIVSQGELDTVLANYFPNSPFLQMTNVAGLGGSNVTFTLSNSTAGAFSVEVTTNLVNWQFLGPATPRYLFTDTNAPANPQRYYRLRWP